MILQLDQVNFWAVLVAAVATFMIGGVWYGAVFAKMWAAIHGFSEEELKCMEKKTLRNFAIFFVGDLLAALVMSIFVINLGIETVGGGVQLGLAIWVGVSVTGGSARNAAYNKPLSAFLIDVCHELLSVVAMCAIVGGWR
jgi:hypothetical protein